MKSLSNYTWDDTQDYLSAATDPGAKSSGQKSNGITHGGYPSTGQAQINPGTITNVGGGNFTISGSIYPGGMVSASSYGYTIEKTQSTSPNLPDMLLVGSDEYGNKVKMTMAPERSISPYESILLTMLVVSYCETPEAFCPLAFVKKNNLEKHFRFS